MVMNATFKFDLPREETQMKDFLNGRRWRAVCMNLDSYLDDEIKNSEDFDSIKGLELAQEKLWELLSHFDVQPFPETLLDEQDK